MFFFFFFSSRRRHTRCLSDWSSDVCSSDLREWANLIVCRLFGVRVAYQVHGGKVDELARGDRKSTRLNSSHLGISYAVFCLKKKKHHILALYRVVHQQNTARNYMTAQRATH